MPYGDDPNDLPLLEMQQDMNTSLVTLLHEKAQIPPEFSPTYGEYASSGEIVCGTTTLEAIFPKPKADRNIATYARQTSQKSARLTRRNTTEVRLGNDRSFDSAMSRQISSRRVSKSFERTISAKSMGTEYSRCTTAGATVDAKRCSETSASAPARVSPESPKEELPLMHVLQRTAVPTPGACDLDESQPRYQPPLPLELQPPSKPVLQLLQDHSLRPHSAEDSSLPPEMEDIKPPLVPNAVCATRQRPEDFSERGSFVSSEVSMSSLPGCPASRR